MLADCSLGRNVRFYDASAPGVALGGSMQNGSVTEVSFLEILGILLITDVHVHVQERRSGHIVSMTNNGPQTGTYTFIAMENVLFQAL